MDLFNFIVMQHIWPEHIIYQTPVPLKQRARAYWAFADLVNVVDGQRLLHRSRLLPQS